MEETRPTSDKSKKAYEKPEMKVENIHRFFFAVCQVTWPFCYSQNVTYPMQPNCRN